MSDISLWEIAMLVGKGRLSQGVDAATALENNAAIVTSDRLLRQQRFVPTLW